MLAGTGKREQLRPDAAKIVLALSYLAESQPGSAKAFFAAVLRLLDALHADGNLPCAPIDFLKYHPSPEIQKRFEETLGKFVQV